MRDEGGRGTGMVLNPRPARADNQCMDRNPDPAAASASLPSPEKKGRNDTPTPPLPPAPADAAVLTRQEAASFFGVSFGTFGVWEREGRVTVQRYRAADGVGRAIYYAVDDLTRLREEFRRLGEPYPDPQHPGCYRVPIRSRIHSLEAIIDAVDLPKVQGRYWNWSPSRDGRPGEVLLATTGAQTPLKRIILGLEGAGRGINIIYANGDPLDLRRGNLVVRTSEKKCRAARKPEARAGVACSSKYRGVTWDTARRMWKAQIGTRESHSQLGRFSDEVEAALAYDAAARKQYGPQAQLNFPGGPGTAPARTGLDPWGEPVRAKNKYRVTPPLPPPPEGVQVMTREEAADLLGVSEKTFCVWERGGRVAIPQYRVAPVTGTPILYAVPDLERLREEFAREGQPYADAKDPGTWRVPIWTKQGFIEALIDAQDLPLVRGRCWNFTRREEDWGNHQERAVVVLTGPRGTPHTPLKRLIMGVLDQPLSVAVVHLNGDALDCRRGNLELRTASQKVRRNHKITHRAGEPTSSAYKGVCWIEREGKWQAQIRVGEKPRKLGLFDDELSAALAYDEAARELWGVEARVNFPEPGELPTAMRTPPSEAARPPKPTLAA